MISFNLFPHGRAEFCLILLGRKPYYKLRRNSVLHSNILGLLIVGIFIMLLSCPQISVLKVLLGSSELTGCRFISGLRRLGN